MYIYTYIYMYVCMYVCRNPTASTLQLTSKRWGCICMCAIEHWLMKLNLKLKLTLK